MSDDSEQIVAAMERIRRSKVKKLELLSEDSQRLTDWRQYARSAPVTSLAGAIVAGAIVGSRLADRTIVERSLLPLQPTSASQPLPGLPERVLGATISIAIPILKAAARQQLSAAFSSAIQTMSASRSPHDDPSA